MAQAKAQDQNKKKTVREVDPLAGSDNTAGDLSDMWNAFAVLLVTALVVAVALTWRDANCTPYVVGGAVATFVLSGYVAYKQMERKALALLAIDWYVVVLCIGLAIAEFPLLWASFDQSVLNTLGANSWMAPSDAVTNTGVSVGLIVVSLIAWGGSRLSKWSVNTRGRNMLWWVRLLVGLWGVLGLAVPWFTNASFFYVVMPWLVSLACLVGPIALVTVLEHKRYVSDDAAAKAMGSFAVKIGRPTGLGALVALWVTARHLLFPSLSLFRGLTWDAFLLTLLPAVIVCFAVALLLPCAVALAANFARADGRKWFEITHAKAMNKYTEEGPVAEADFQAMLGVITWHDYAMPLLLGGIAVAVDAALRWYFPYSWVGLLIYAAWAWSYACRFADGKGVTPPAFVRTMVGGAALCAVELALVSCGFFPLAAGLPVGLWIVVSQRRKFVARGGNDRPYFQWVMLVCAALAALAMVNTGWSVARATFLAVCLVLASVALWATFHRDPGDVAQNGDGAARTGAGDSDRAADKSAAYGGSNGSAGSGLPGGRVLRGGMYRIRLAMTAGFAVLMLAVAFSAPGAPHIRFETESGHVSNVLVSDEGRKAHVSAGDPGNIVSVRCLVSNNLVFSDELAQEIGAIDVPVQMTGDCLSVWITYADGMTTRGTFWINSHAGWTY